MFIMYSDIISSELSIRLTLLLVSKLYIINISTLYIFCIYSFVFTTNNVIVRGSYEILSYAFLDHNNNRNSNDRTLHNAKSNHVSILILDDEYDIALLIKQFLERRGYSTYAFTNPC
jgi:hypothetical protein